MYRPPAVEAKIVSSFAGFQAGARDQTPAFFWAVFLSLQIDYAVFNLQGFQAGVRDQTPAFFCPQVFLSLQIEYAVFYLQGQVNEVAIVHEA